MPFDFEFEKLGDPQKKDPIGDLQASRIDSWQGRVAANGAAYTSPAGRRVTFDYENVSREYERRGTVWEFPGINNAYVQQTGFGPRRYPLRCFFWGQNHDQVATIFEVGLLTEGVGKLEHPMYGTIDVVPFGTITRRDDLKDAANVTVIEVTFFTTTKSVYPTAQEHPVSEIRRALLDFDNAAALAYQDGTSLTDEVKRANAKAGIRRFLQDVSATLQSVSDSVSSVRREVAEIQGTIDLGMAVLIGQPLLLARQVINLVKSPARAVAGIEDRMAAYRQLAENIFGSRAGRPQEGLAAGTRLPSRVAAIVNDFRTADLFASAAVAGSLSAVTETEFETRPQALNAASELLLQFDSWAAWREEGFSTLEQLPSSNQVVDVGTAYQALQEAVALAAARLIQISWTLVPERRIALDRPRTIVDLCAELYGSVDNRLDFLINTNNLTGDEILELPQGRIIAYYPRP